MVSCDMLTTSLVVSCESSLQLACDCYVRHEECHALLKHVLKSYDNRIATGNFISEIVYDFFMERAACAIKVACEKRKQKSYSI